MTITVAIIMIALCTVYLAIDITGRALELRHRLNAAIDDQQAKDD